MLPNLLKSTTKFSSNFHLSKPFLPFHKLKQGFRKKNWPFASILPYLLINTILTAAKHPLGTSKKKNVFPMKKECFHS